MMAKKVIVVNQLTKDFKIFKRSAGFIGSIKDLFLREYTIKRAVDGLDFYLNQGDILGLVGPNGSGKTSTVKLLTGIMSPTHGNVLINGQDSFINRKRLVERIGVMFAQRSNLVWDLSVEEGLRTNHSLYSSKESFSSAINEFKKIVDIEPLLKIPVRKLSLGQRTLCDLVSTVIYFPDFLFLDEPTIGLDFYAKEQIYNLIRYLNKSRGTTVLITSHNLNDIEQLSRKILLLDKGKVLFGGNFEELLDMGETVENKIIITYEDAEEKNIEQLKSLQNIRIKYTSHNKIEILYLPNKVNKVNLLKAIVENPRLQDLELAKPGIEEIIKNIYTRSHCSE